MEKSPVLFSFSPFSCAPDSKPSCGVRGMRAYRILKLREENHPSDQKSCGPKSIGQIPNAFFLFFPFLLPLVSLDTDAVVENAWKSRLSKAPAFCPGDQKVEPLGTGNYHREGRARESNPRKLLMNFWAHP